MYSFQPLPTPGPDYLSAVILSFVVCIIVFAVWGLFYRDIPDWERDKTVIKEKKAFNLMLLSISGTVGIALASMMSISLIANVDLPPKNEKVVGVFKGYLPSGYEYRSGKTTKYTNALYGIYAVPEGEVVMELRTGIYYPERVVMYKN